MRIFRILTVLPVFALLGGCQWVLLWPSGDVAVQQRNLMLASTALMLLVILPVMALTIFFAWRYRASARATLPACAVLAGKDRFSIESKPTEKVMRSKLFIDSEENA